MKIIFNENRTYFIFFAFFCACLFIGSHVYSSWDIDSVNPMELYEMDKFNWERDNPYLKALGYMSYNAWLRLQDELVQDCKKRKNCESWEDRRHGEWIHYMDDTTNCISKSWYDSDNGKKENN